MSKNIIHEWQQRGEGEEEGGRKGDQDWRGGRRERMITRHEFEHDWGYVRVRGKREGGDGEAHHLLRFQLHLGGG